MSVSYFDSLSPLLLKLRRDSVAAVNDRVGDREKSVLRYLQVCLLVSPSVSLSISMLVSKIIILADKEMDRQTHRHADTQTHTHCQPTILPGPLQ